MSGGDFTEAVRRHMSGFDRHLGLEITEATATRVQGRLAIELHHMQIHGVVHGGVYTCIVETLGSVGAALSARVHGLTIVGIENSTSFLRAAGAGTLSAEAVPLTAGRRTQVWTTRISDEQGHLVAVGQLRILCIEDGSMPHSSRRPTPATGWDPFKLGEKNH